MDFSKFRPGSGPSDMPQIPIPDPGTYLKRELEEGLEPITRRVDSLEKKLDLLILTAQRVEDLLKAMRPVSDLIKKIPFIR